MKALEPLATFATDCLGLEAHGDQPADATALFNKLLRLR